MDYKKLTRAVAQDAALRRRQVLQPVGGKGDKIFPPTYPASDAARSRDAKAPPRHIFEQRRIRGAPVWPRHGIRVNGR
jgi:CRISPR-associated protein Csb1